MQSDELGHCIRAWRDRLDPGAAGLSAGARRRAPGLRREVPAALLARRPVATRTASRKTIEHPEVGPITVDCDVVTVQGGNLRLVVYSAAPKTPDAEKLALLGVVGLQRMSA